MEKTGRESGGEGGSEGRENAGSATGGSGYERGITAGFCACARSVSASETEYGCVNAWRCCEGALRLSRACTSRKS